MIRIVTHPFNPVLEEQLVHYFNNLLHRLGMNDTTVSIRGEEQGMKEVVLQDAQLINQHISLVIK
jgi:hypothetical protein